MERDRLEVTGRDGMVDVYRRKDNIWQLEMPYLDAWYDVTDWHETALCDALLAARREWVPCSERLPPLKKRVLIKESDSAYIITADFDGTNWWCDDGTRGLPSHWMPLPSPPKETT